ncbi:hypothetical protein BRC90_08470 [Halobacteriales archaeon QS_4_69_34]|nr:MAG: hypothetical protein BRC90_08470 [Halobacteriales archaeon QS_4_69_34]
MCGETSDALVSTDIGDTPDLAIVIDTLAERLARLELPTGFEASTQIIGSSDEGVVAAFDVARHRDWNIQRCADKIEYVGDALRLCGR